MPTLQLTTVYRSDNFKIEADDSLAYIRTEWLRPLDDEQFVVEAMRAHDVISEKQAERVLVNAEQVSILGPETKDWLSNTYYSLFSLTSVNRVTNRSITAITGAACITWAWARVRIRLTEHHGNTMWPTTASIPKPSTKAASRQK